MLAGQEVRLFDPVTNAEVAKGSEGEIRIAGPGLMAGYLGSAEQPIVDGWLQTGDLGRFDDEGSLWITGRIKDVIIRGGENISPAQSSGILRHIPPAGLLRHRRAGCQSRRGADRLRRVEDGEVLDEPGLKAFVTALWRASMCLPRSVGWTCSNQRRGQA